MTQSSFSVGYGRPPVHTRFQKGHSGNPGGKPGPKRRLKDEFDEALAGALDGDRWELKDAQPRRGVEALARQVVLDALAGQSSALKIVLTRLDGKDRGDTHVSPEAEAEAADEDNGAERGEAGIVAAANDASGSAVESADDENDDDEVEEELTDEDRFKFDFARDMVGDRYDEIKERIKRAVDAGDMAALCDAVGEAEEVRIKLAAERKRDAMADGEGQSG